MRSAGLALAACFALGASAAAEPECAASASSVRVMLHDADVLAARLDVLAQAPEERTGRIATARTLFEATGCPQILELGDERGRNVECSVPGTGHGVIVVGASQQFDSLGTLALLPSLAEALAVAPRKHTFRWVAFSAHEATTHGARAQKPKGATRLLSALTEAGRAELRLMVHLGPLGLGSLGVHPSSAESRLRCSLESAARSAGIELAKRTASDPDCRVKRDAGPGSRLPGGGRGFMVICPDGHRTEGGVDWQPFRRAGVPVFGLHSGTAGRVSSTVDFEQYLRTYRALAIFLALADDALAPPPGAHAAPE